MTFQVAQSGQSVSVASGPQSLLNDKWPLSKLDVTKTISFQTISILFNHEPPQPDPSTFISNTLIYQFAHGYNYIPATWMEWQNPAPSYPPAPTTPGAYANTFPIFGDDSAASNGQNGGSASQLSLFCDEAYYDTNFGVGNASIAFFYTKVDATNVYIYLNKTGLIPDSVTFNPVPIYIIGATCNMRIYTFVEPGTTSTY